MSSKYLRILIVGLALFIVGPALGLLLTWFGVRHTQEALLNQQPATLADAFQILRDTPSRINDNLTFTVVAYLVGAVGLFLVLYAFVMHIWGPKQHVAVSAPPAVLSSRDASRTPTPPSPLAVSHGVSPQQKTGLANACEDLGKPLTQPAQDDSRYMPKH